MPVDRNCPICQGNDYCLPKMRGHARLPLQPVICKGCGLVFINPMYTDPEKEAGLQGARQLHRPVRFRHSLEQAHNRQRAGARRMMAVLRERLREGDQVLDIGCGDGALLRALQRIGAVPIGCDLDPVGATFIQEKYGIPVVVAPFEEAGFRDGEFDMVVATHVIEHIFEPVEAIRKMRRLLKATGTLALETPNLMRPKVGPTRFISLPHSYYFSPRTLCLALHNGGFQTRAVREFERDSFVVVAQPAEVCAADRPAGDDWREIEQRMNQHALSYRASLQFLWRKIPGLKSLLMYHVHEDRRGEELDRWLRRAA